MLHEAVEQCGAAGKKGDALPFNDVESDLGEVSLHDSQRSATPRAEIEAHGKRVGVVERSYCQNSFIRLRWQKGFSLCDIGRDGKMLQIDSLGAAGRSTSVLQCRERRRIRQAQRSRAVVPAG